MTTLREAAYALATALTAVYEAPEAAAVAREVWQEALQLDGLGYTLAAGQPVPADAQARVAAWLPRLLAHEPVQYVLGRAYFAGLRLEVNSATLIPRPETEELLQLVLRGQPGQRLLDVGTGSGCLALGLAQAWPQAQVWGVDVSAEALAVARRNAARYGLAVQWERVDILQALPSVAPGTVDALVSNPPYVRDSERALMRENVLAWEPATALFVPDDDPLVFYRRLAAVGEVLLRPGGGLYLEINEALGAETAALLVAHRFADVRVRADMFGRVRFVCGIRA